MRLTAAQQRDGLASRAEMGTPALTRCAVLAAVGAAVIAGCGGRSSHTSKADKAFIARVDRSCRVFRVERRQAGLARRAGKPTPAERARQLGARAALRQRQLGRLRTISPPADERSSYERFVSTWAQQVAITRDSARAAARNDAAALRVNAGRDRQLNRAYVKLAGDLGLKVCGQRPGR